MPNGGSDNCMNCWFNRSTRGARGKSEYWKFFDRAPEKQYCELRDTAIPDPAYTHCNNMSFVSWGRPELDPIPIGPILVSEIIPGSFAYERVIWKRSPDSDEIRDHLLRLLETSTSDISEVDEYWHRTRPGPGLAPTVMWQLAQFREQRATERLRWIRDNCPDWLANPAREALREILEDRPAAPAD